MPVMRRLRWYAEPIVSASSVAATVAIAGRVRDCGLMIVRGAGRPASGHAGGSRDDHDKHDH
jgi:hypothetical protein